MVSEIIEAKVEELFPNLALLFQKLDNFELKYMQCYGNQGPGERGEEELQKLQNSVAAISQKRFQFKYEREELKQLISSYLKRKDEEQIPPSNQYEQLASNDNNYYIPKLQTAQEVKEPPVNKKFRSQVYIQQAFFYGENNPPNIAPEPQVQHDLNSHYLITLQGVYNLRTKKYVAQEFNTQWKEMAAYQLNSTLYLCGGKKLKGGYIYSGNLMAKNYRGQWTYQPSMKCKRSCVGFSGANQELAAVGGENEEGPLDVFELYSKVKKFWSRKASLNMERAWPGVCFFQSRQIYCFCGEKTGRPLKSIEKISLNTMKPEWNKFWKSEAEPCFNLKAMEFRGKIVVFGGFFFAREKLSLTMTFTKQGKLVEQDGEGPVLQGEFPCIVYNNTLYAGYNSYGQDHIKSYDGDDWTVVYP